MNCPRCDHRMVPLKHVHCATGDAQLHRCPQCGARAYQQMTATLSRWSKPLAETHRQILAKSEVQAYGE